MSNDQDGMARASARTGSSLRLLVPGVTEESVAAARAHAARERRALLETTGLEIGEDGKVVLK